MYRTVLVSGVLLFGDSLKHSINQMRSHIEVVRSFGTLESTSEIGELMPDLFAIALEQLNPSHCLEAIRSVKRASPATKFVLLYGENHAHDVAWLADADPDAREWSFIHVDHVGEVAELCRTFVRVAQGETVRIPDMGFRAMDERGAGRHVTPGELKALRTLAAGISARGGAQKLGWSLANLIRR